MMRTTRPAGGTSRSWRGGDRGRCSRNNPSRCRGTRGGGAPGRGRGATVVNRMARLGKEKVLLIAAAQRDVHAALIAAIPSATITAVNDYFDAIAELTANPYTTVLAAAEPVERRPEAAIRAIRDLV